MWTAVPLVFSRCTFSVKVTRRPCHAAVSSVLAQPERHHLFKCAEIKGALHLCVSASERWGDIIFLNRESALKRCLLASVRSHQGTELLFGGSHSSNGCEGKNYCFLFNKPQNNPVYRGERQRSGFALDLCKVCPAKVCVTVLLPWVPCPVLPLEVEWAIAANLHLQSPSSGRLRLSGLLEI